VRDIVLATFVFGLLPFILRNPLLGAYAWAWMSMMNPHRATYGFARTLPFAQAIALVTLIGLLFSKDRKPIPRTPITAVQLLLLFWMTVTSFFAMNHTDLVVDRWVFVMKIQVMLFVTFMLVRGRTDIERLIWVVTFSIGFYGIKGGIWTVITGGGGRVWGPAGSMIYGNNELAVALVMLVPMMYYLHRVATARWVRWALLACMLFASLSILGSQSRGALLALVAMTYVLAIKGAHPVRMTVILTLLLLLAFAFMPASWLDRMDTIQSYEQDGSAMSRIYTWKTLWNVALDRPLVGAGFAADNSFVFGRYAPQDPQFAFFQGMIFVAHSIYLQMLGEHGFPGLALFLLLGVVTWFTARRLAIETKDDPEFGAWVPMLMPMVQVSLIGFAVGGAFLSLAYFDLPYYIVGIVLLVDVTWREHKRATQWVPPSRASAGQPMAIGTRA
jgi:probable O-glycosylation ligase (exosortase A-associated)